MAEGGEKDLGERELVEDRFVDPDAKSAGGGNGGAMAGAHKVEEDDIIAVDDLQLSSHRSSPARPLSPEGAALFSRLHLPVNL